jgi:hypothetical protein
MSCKILQVFLAHPNAEITLPGLEWLAQGNYRREALRWGLRALERRASLRSRTRAPGLRCYWLTDDPEVRAALKYCLIYYGARPGNSHPGTHGTV